MVKERVEWMQDSLWHGRINRDRGINKKIYIENNRTSEGWRDGYLCAKGGGGGGMNA